jgi:hypothetical protein
MSIDKRLKVAYGEHVQTLKSSRAISSFALDFVGYVMHRYLMFLHVPFLSPGVCNVAFAYSRKTYVEIALKAWAAACHAAAIEGLRS